MPEEAPGQGQRTLPNGADSGNRSVVSDKTQMVAVELKYSRAVAVAEPGRARSYLGEDAVRIGWRA